MDALKLAPPQANKLLTYVTIEALNTWSQFVRYYVLSLANRPRRGGGGAVRVGLAGVNGPQDVLAVAMKLLRPRTPPSAAGTWARRDEPTWHEVRTLVDCAAALSVSNLGDIQAAVSIGTRVFLDLPVFRNFFAHRNDASLASASGLAIRYGIASGHPSVVLLARPSGRPWPLIVEWVDDLSVVTDLLCH